MGASVLFKASVPNTWLNGIAWLRSCAKRVGIPTAPAKFFDGHCECGQPKMKKDRACDRCAHLESYAAKVDRVVERAIIAELADADELSTRALVGLLGVEREHVHSTLRRLVHEGKLTRRRDDNANAWIYSLATDEVLP